MGAKYSQVQSARAAIQAQKAEQLARREEWKKMFPHIQGLQAKIKTREFPKVDAPRAGDYPDTSPTTADQGDVQVSRRNPNVPLTHPDNKYDPWSQLLLRLATNIVSMPWSHWVGSVYQPAEALPSSGDLKYLGEAEASQEKRIPQDAIREVLDWKKNGGSEEALVDIATRYDVEPKDLENIATWTRGYSVTARYASTSGGAALPFKNEPRRGGPTAPIFARSH